MKSKGLIKLALSIAMVLLVARSVEWSELAATFRSIPLWTAALVIFGYTAGQLISSVKWWMIVRAGKIDVSYPNALKAYFIGMFVNCFGFGMVGGDVARGLLVAQGMPKKTEGLASVVIDRIHGLTVLSGIALLTSVVLGNQHVPSHFLLLLVGLITGFVGFWLIGPWFLERWLLVRLPTFVPMRIAAKLAEVAQVFPRKLSTLIPITILSILFHTLQITLHAAMAAGVGANIPWATLFVVIPFVNIASSLPISWNGLGVRENSYIFFLAPAILSKEQALAFGALWLLAMTVASAIGGIVALCTGDLKSLRMQSKIPNLEVIEGGGKGEARQLSSRA